MDEARLIAVTAKDTWATPWPPGSSPLSRRGGGRTDHNPASGGRWCVIPGGP
jgi:hypothetical protein